MVSARIVAVAAAALLLAGCTSTPPTDATHSPSTQAPSVATPTPEPTAAAQPELRLDVTCDQLADPQMIELAIGQKLDSVDPLEYSFSQSAAMYYDYPVLQQGGLTCLWQNSVAADDETFASVMVDVLPGATDQFETTFDGDTSDPSCGNGYCSVDLLVDGTWLQVFLSGAEPALAEPVDGAPLPAEIDALVNNMAGVIEAAGAPLDAVDPQAAPEGKKCDSYLDADVVHEATGIPSELATYNGADGPQIGMSFDKDGNGLVTYCIVTFAAGEAREPLSASILPDAEWAMRASVAHNSPAGTGVEQPVEGIPEGDAFQRCESVHEGQITCYLDMLVDSTWVQLALTTTIDAPVGTEIEADPIDALTMIAASMAAKL